MHCKHLFLINVNYLIISPLLYFVFDSVFLIYLNLVTSHLPNMYFCVIFSYIVTSYKSFVVHFRCKLNKESK